MDKLTDSQRTEQDTERFLRLSIQIKASAHSASLSLTVSQARHKQGSVKGSCTGTESPGPFEIAGKGQTELGCVQVDGEAHGRKTDPANSFTNLMTFPMFPRCVRSRA